jgi:hypothetical protein
MLEKLSNKLKDFAKGWLVLVLFVLDGFFMFFVMPMLGALMQGDNGGPGPLDLNFFYTPDKAFAMIASYGEYGRAFYRNIELTADIIYPIVYTLFFSLCITWFFQRAFAAGSKLQRLNVVPFGAWLFDLFENLGIVVLLTVYPSQPAALAWLTAVFTALKWTFAGASILLTLFGIGAFAVKKLRK